MAGPLPSTVFPSAALRTEDGRPAAPPATEALYVFFHTECPTSELSWPFVERLARIAGEGGLRVVAVSQDDPEQTREFRRRHGEEVDTVYDPPPWKASEALALTGVPAFVRVAAEGTLREVVVGFQKEKLEEFARSAAALSGTAAGSLFRPDESVPAIRPG